MFKRAIHQLKQLLCNEHQRGKMCCLNSVFIGQRHWIQEGGVSTISDHALSCLRQGPQICFQNKWAEKVIPPTHQVEPTNWWIRATLFGSAPLTHWLPPCLQAWRCTSEHTENWLLNAALKSQWISFQPRLQYEMLFDWMHFLFCWTEERMNNDKHYLFF